MRDHRTAGLSPPEAALAAYAEKATLHADEITAADVEDLRRHGFSDAEILDVAMTVGARSLFSRVLDAVGAEPDERYNELEPALRHALTVGRPLRPRSKSGG